MTRSVEQKHDAKCDPPPYRRVLEARVLEHPQARVLERALGARLRLVAVHGGGVGRHHVAAQVDPCESKTLETQENHTSEDEVLKP